MTASFVILSDGRAGHYNLSTGLLSGFDPTATPRMLDLPAPRKPLKRLVLLGSTLFRHCPRILKTLYQAYYGTPPPAILTEKLIVSTGGDTLVANIILAAVHGIPNIFLGRRSWFTHAGVRLLVTTAGKPVTDRVLVLPLAPVSAPAMPGPPRSGPIRLMAVLIGGDSNEYRYTAADYSTLAASLNKLCARTGIRLLLSTSRRTGLANETVLRETLDPSVIEEATWYNSAPRPVSQDYYRRADCILCGEDSGTMLTEAIAWRKPVLAFRPQDCRTTNFYNNFLRRVADCHVCFHSLEELANAEPDRMPAAVPPDMTATHAAMTQLLL